MIDSFVPLETIIPVCPPACDQYQRGDAVSLSRSSIVVFGVSLLLMFR